jgi:hypothetical protein
MVKISQFALIAATCMIAASASLLNLEQVLPDFSDEKHVKYMMASARGFSSGFAQGLFNNRSEIVSKQCMGESVFKNFADFNRFLFSGDFIQIFKSVGKFYQIGFDIQKTCRFNELAFEVTGFILNKTNNITADTLITNFQAQFFTFTDAMNKIAQVLFEEYANSGKQDFSNADESESNYADLGFSIGKVFRTITKFSKTKSDGGKKPRRSMDMLE